MKEKEIVQTIGETDPEMKELWPLIEKVFDEVAALRLREPGLSPRLDDLQTALQEAKDNSRRLLAFHKDLSHGKHHITGIVVLEDLERDNSITHYEARPWTPERPNWTVEKLPDTEYADYDWETHKMVRRKRPAPGSTAKLAEAVEKLQKRTSQLLKIKKKNDPKLQVPLYKQVLDRLAGTSFTAREGARIGYQIQLERGQRPTSQSARIYKSMDIRNFQEDQVLGKVDKGLTYDPTTGVYTLAKDYTLEVPVKNFVGEELEKAKKKYGKLALRLQELQQKTGKKYAHTVDRRNKEHMTMQQLEIDMGNLAWRMTVASRNAALKDVNLKLDDDGSYLSRK